MPGSPYSDFSARYRREIGTVHITMINRQILGKNRREIAEKSLRK